MERMVMLCVFLGCVACSGEESAAQKCDDLVSDVCDRAVACIPAQAGTHDTCVQQVQQVVPCGSAKKVGTSYSRCISQIKGDSCPVLFPADPQTGEPVLSLPADCMGVIQMFEPGEVSGSVFDGARALSSVSDR